jgi:hypothetical protein
MKIITGLLLIKRFLYRHIARLTTLGFHEVHVLGNVSCETKKLVHPINLALVDTLEVIKKSKIRWVIDKT